MSEPSNAAIACMAWGGLLIAIAGFRPSWIRWIPGMRWFHGGHAIRRVGAIVWGATFVLIGVFLSDWVPQGLKGVIVLLWTFILLGTAIYEAPWARDGGDELDEQSRDVSSGPFPMAETRVETCEGEREDRSRDDAARPLS